MAGIDSSPLPYRTPAAAPGTPSMGRAIRASVDLDELAEDTIPCSPFFTQPTQVVNRVSLAPQLELFSSPARTIVEVPASSPFQPKSSNKPSAGGPLASRLAPAGTLFRAPPRLPAPTMKRPAEAPILISDDEDDLSPARGDIQPTAFRRQISSFEYVPEDAVQKKVKQVSEMTGGTIPIDLCRSALLSCHHNVSDAVNYLLDGKHLSGKSNIIARGSSKPNMPSTGASRKASPAKLATPAPSTPSPAKPKARRRLMQGRRPGRSPPPSSSQVSQPSNTVKEVTPELERRADESIIIIDDKEDEYDNTDEELSQTVKESLWSQALRAINTSTIEDLSAMTNLKQEDLKIIEMKRPFATIEEVNRTAPPKKSGSRKSARIAIGEALVDAIMEFTKAVNAIDEVVAECDHKANVVKREMNLWDIDFKGHKRGKQTTSDDELPLTPNSMKSAKYSEPPIPRQPQFMEGHCEMRPFQLYGLNWMDLLYNKGYGCILADEMGLGKTCQVISLICHLVESYERGSNSTSDERPWPNLIVVPPSTFSNWLVEFERFAPDLSVLAYQGPQALRREIGEELLSNPEDYHVVITTYTQVGTEEDIETMQMMGPNAAIFDEGHKMKNPKTKVYKDLIRIKAGWRMLLTGTPIQNNLMEMLSLLNFIDPKMFNGHMDQLQYLFSQKVSLRDVGNRAFLYGERVSRAKTILEPFILQRRKQQVLTDMPTKTCTVVYCDLAPSQQDVYDTYERLFKSGPVKQDTAARQSDQNNVWMQLRKAAIHPQLFRRHFDDKKVERMADILMKKVPQHELQQPELKHLIGELKNASDFELHLWCRDYPCIEKFDVPDKSWLNSGKVAKMLELIRQYRENGDRVLVFSKFAKVVEILREVLFTDGIEHCVLYGQTSVSERQDLIDQYNNNPKITAFLLTTGAGGTGINLTSANKVIIFDQSDNPQDDIQAENRAHRLGQTRDVEVIRLLTSHTIEELIYKACEKKIELANKVTGAIEDLAENAEENLEKEVRKMMAEQLTPP